MRYDYLTLEALSSDIEELIRSIPRSTNRRTALDIGCESSPYRRLLEDAGYSVQTLDIEPSSGADHLGRAEETGLLEAQFDLVTCTQVLEHCDNPWDAVKEAHRILKPQGFLLASVPHVWFFHPHPKDHWRFTQQGLVRLCEENGFEMRTLLAQGGTVLAAAQVLNFLSFGMLGRAGWPLYTMTNLISKPLDGLVANDLFCINFACLAQRV